MAIDPRGRSQESPVVLLLIGLFFLVQGLLLVWVVLGPNQSLNPPLTEPYLVVGEQLLGQVHLEDEQIMISLELLQQQWDPYAFWDADRQEVIITTANKVLVMPTYRAEAEVNGSIIPLAFPATVLNGKPYLPLQFLAPLYGLEISVYPAFGRAVVYEQGSALQHAQVTKSTALRQGPSWRTPVLLWLSPGEELEVFAEQGGLLRVRRQGVLGWVDERDLKLTTIKHYSSITSPAQAPPAWKPLGGKINLTWEHVLRQTPVMRTDTSLPGVNVVSPTWFYLADEAGQVGNRADMRYVEWAHAQGYQVWALFDNRFNPELTSKVLRDSDLRRQVIQQIMVYAQLYQLDGINLDFENMVLEDSRFYVQFVREITPWLHELGLTVSVDVTIKSSSANWSRVYNRQALAQVVDYVMLMTYDEHPAASPQAGSVASLPWVERGLRGVLEEVPASKLLLGVPFYTRVWEEQGGKVSSRAMSMDQAERFLRQNKAVITWDKKAQQNLGRFERDGVRHSIWLEDGESIAQRLQLVNKYGLAGVASWRRGFEQPGVWDLIIEKLDQRPRH